MSNCNFFVYFNALIIYRYVIFWVAKASFGAPCFVADYVFIQTTLCAQIWLSLASTEALSTAFL